VHAGTHEFVDCELRRRRIGRDQHDAIKVREPGQFGRVRLRFRYVEPQRQFSDVLMAKVACGLGNLPIDHVEEREPRSGEHVTQIGIAAKRVAAALRRFDAERAHRVAHALHGFRIHARPVIEHAIDRRGTHACGFGDLRNRYVAGHGRSLFLDLLWARILMSIKK